MIARFELSRIYADGWKAASALTMDQRDELAGRGGIAALNPWPVSQKQEYSRWADGFGRALGQKKQMPFRRSLPAPASR